MAKAGGVVKRFREVVSQGMYLKCTAGHSWAQQGTAGQSWAQLGTAGQIWAQLGTAGHSWAQLGNKPLVKSLLLLNFKPTG